MLKNEKIGAVALDVFSTAFWNEIEEERYGKKRIAKNTKEYLNNGDFYNLFQMKSPKIGDYVEGVISTITEKEILVDFGYKDFLYIDTKSTIDYITGLDYNTPIKVMIVNIKEKPYKIVGSIVDIMQKEGLEKLKSTFKDGVGFPCYVDEIIPAGYHVTIYIDNCKFRGFMPNFLAGVNRVFNPKQLLGKQINVMLETLDCDKNIYIVSRRKYLQQQIPNEIKKLKKTTVYTGRVTGCKKFGVFVELNGCLTCLIPRENLDEMYHKYLDEENIPNDTQIEFYIADVIDDKKIVGSQYYIETVCDTMNVGSEMEGTIVSIYNLGYLVNLGKDCNGLAMSNNIQSNKKNYNNGDKVKVKVISINRDEQQSMLSIM